MKLKDYLAMSFLLILSSILIIIWFRGDWVFGGGDVGLPTYNPKRIFEFISYVWWEASAPGFPRPHGITGIPFYLILSFLQGLIPSYVMIQKIIFWLVLVFAGIGMYFVSKTVFGKDKTIIPLASSLLYLFNPYMMISVWHRFVHTTFFFAAAVPFIFITWRRWIIYGKSFDLLIFSLINIIGAIIFSSLGLVVSLWILLGAYFIYCLLIPGKTPSKAKLYTKRFFLGFFVWIGISLWWLLPVAFTGSTIFSEQHTSQENTGTLLELAKQSTIPNTIQGINPFYLFFEKDFGNIYMGWYFMLMPWLWVFFAILGFLKGLGDKRFIFWSLFFLLAIFFAKGAASPFGGGFTYLFDRFFILGVLRNPFEKIGIFIPFTYAILIPLGFATFYQIAKRVRLQYLYFALLILSVLTIIFWHWPFWTGNLFGSQFNNQKVKIPQYYFDADDWITRQTLPGRILHLPLVVSESITYDWDLGYSGVEPSQVFFTSNPSLSQGFNLKFLDSALKTLQISLNKSDLIEQEAIKKLFKIFGIRFIVLHMDVDTSKVDAYNPIKLKEKLGKMQFLKKGGEFGKLIIYEVDIEQASDIVYVAEGYDYLVLGETNDFWPYFISDKNNQLVSSLDPSNKKWMQKAKSLIVVPYYSFYSPFGISVNLENILDELPAVRIMPTSPLYHLIKLKEHYETYSSYGNRRLMKQILFSSKRLVEAFKTKQIDLKSYLKLLDQLYYPLRHSLPAERDALQAVFFRQIVMLDKLGEFADTDEKKNMLMEARGKLREYLAYWRLLPLFTSYDDQYIDRKVFAINIPKEYDYEILLGLNEGMSALDIEEFSLDGERIDFVTDENQQNEGIRAIKFFKAHLKEGYHEFSYKSKSQTVEVPSLDDWIKSGNGQYSNPQEGFSIAGAQNEDTEIKLVANNFIKGSRYTLQFDFWVQAGNGPKVEILQDSNVTSNQIFSADSYNRHWQKASLSFKVGENTNEVTIKLSVQPWEDCEEVSPTPALCSDSEFRRKFTRQSKVTVENLTLTRVSEPTILLKASVDEESKNLETHGLVINYQRVNPTYLSGVFKVSNPSFLVFAETFDKGWKLDLFKDGQKVNLGEHVLMNVFSNGWFIAEPGEYQFIIYFAAQRLVLFGSIICFIILGGLLWFLKGQKK